MRNNFTSEQMLYTVRRVESGTTLAQTEREARLAQVIKSVRFRDGLQEEAQRIAA